LAGIDSFKQLGIIVLLTEEYALVVAYLL